MTYRFALILAVLVALARSVDACSVGDMFIPPTNYELVATTPRIALAKAIRAVTPTSIELEIVGIVKGPGKIGERIQVEGSTTRYRGGSNKHDFARAREGAYAGHCTAFDYQLDKHYLLFLEQADQGRWNTSGVPFARVNEEIDQHDDPWTVAVTTYAKIAGLSSAEDRKSALEALAKKTTTATDKAIAEDITRHFAAPTPFKSFAELDRMYRSASTREERNRVVRAIGVGGDQAARGFMTELVTALRSGASSVDQRAAIGAIAVYYMQVSDPPGLAKLAELYASLGSKAADEGWDLLSILIRHCDASHQHVMERLLTRADDDAVGQLVQFFVRFPSEKARRQVRRRLGKAYAQKWEMTLGLAGMGDRDVLAWAQKRLAAKSDEGRWIALSAIAVSPLPEADALVPGIVERGGEDLVDLIAGYENARHPKADARLAELDKLQLDEEARRRLAVTVEARAAR